MIRYSPIKFKHTPARVEERNGWKIVLQYEDEGTGPNLVDLSHIGKWDLQGEDLPSLRPAGIPIPENSKQCTPRRDYLINLIKWNWATIWHFSVDLPDFAGEYPFTNITEAYALLALIGKETFAIMEKVTSLNLLSPLRKPPFLVLGPVLHIRSQVVVLSRDKDKSSVLLSCSRGYGQSMADAMLDAGKEWGIKPGGENLFMDYRKLYFEN